MMNNSSIVRGRKGEHLLGKEQRFPGKAIEGEATGEVPREEDHTRSDTEARPAEKYTTRTCV